MIAKSNYSGHPGIVYFLMLDTCSLSARLASRAVPEGDITIRLQDKFVYDKAERNQGKILLQKTQSQAIKATPAARITK
jgi:hypothetical protein